MGDDAEFGFPGGVSLPPPRKAGGETVCLTGIITKSKTGTITLKDGKTMKTGQFHFLISGVETFPNTFRTSRGNNAYVSNNPSHLSCNPSIIWKKESDGSSSGGGGMKRQKFSINEHISETSRSIAESKNMEIRARLQARLDWFDTVPKDMKIVLSPGIHMRFSLSSNGETNNILEGQAKINFDWEPMYERDTYREGKARENGEDVGNLYKVNTWVNITRISKLHLSASGYNETLLNKLFITEAKQIYERNCAFGVLPFPMFKDIYQVQGISFIFPISFVPGREVIDDQQSKTVSFGIHRVRCGAHEVNASGDPIIENDVTKKNITTKILSLPLNIMIKTIGNSDPSCNNSDSKKSVGRAVSQIHVFQVIYNKNIPTDETDPYMRLGLYSQNDVKAFYKIAESGNATDIWAIGKYQWDDPHSTPPDDSNYNSVSTVQIETLRLSWKYLCDTWGLKVDFANLKKLFTSNHFSSANPVQVYGGDADLARNTRYATILKANQGCFVNSLYHETNDILQKSSNYVIVTSSFLSKAHTHLQLHKKYIELKSKDEDLPDADVWIEANEKSFPVKRFSSIHEFVAVNKLKSAADGTFTSGTIIENICTHLPASEKTLLVASIPKDYSEEPEVIEKLTYKRHYGTQYRTTGVFFDKLENDPYTVQPFTRPITTGLSEDGDDGGSNNPNPISEVIITKKIPTETSSSSKSSPPPTPVTETQSVTTVDEQQPPIEEDELMSLAPPPMTKKRQFSDDEYEDEHSDSLKKKKKEPKKKQGKKGAVNSKIHSDDIVDEEGYNS